MFNARQLTVCGSLVGNPHELKELVDHVSGWADPTDSDTQRVDRKGERGPRRSARGSDPGADRAPARANGSL